MKYSFILILLFLPAILFSQEIVSGKTTLDELLMTDHKKWFDKNYHEYQPDMNVIQSLPDSENISIKIVGGTWCSDTKTYLPVFYKVIDLWQFNHQRIEMIFVDRSKTIKLKNFKKLLITHVPTFIIYNAKGKELGRIVETPSVTIEKDLFQILNHHKN